MSETSISRHTDSISEWTVNLTINKAAYGV
jgi:hypothetical protein